MGVSRGVIPVSIEPPPTRGLRLESGMGWKSKFLSVTLPAMKTLSILALLSFSCCVEIALAREPDQASVANDVKAIMSAIYKPDYDLILKHTHEKVLEITGGKDAFLKAIKQTHNFLKEGGVSFNKAEVGRKIDYFAGTDNEFFFVPTRITLNGPDGTITESSHPLGVKKKTGNVWKYFDCSALNEYLVRGWFPDFPKGKKLP
jgi:hypothetical protein